jgi:hypothetical protein
MWSIPNFIPLVCICPSPSFHPKISPYDSTILYLTDDPFQPPDKILQIWRAVEPFDFHTTFGAFAGVDVRGGKELKMRLLESAKIAVRAMGYSGHALLAEAV